MRYPPGDEIYRDEILSVFEVDGLREDEYGENLCLLSKLFLDHKRVASIVELFYFYVVCERDDEGYRLIGYFSKEKEYYKVVSAK